MEAPKNNTEKSHVGDDGESLANKLTHCNLIKFLFLL